MTLLAPHLTAFMRERLPRERRASPHTCDSYAYAFQLLLAFAAKRVRTRPSDLKLEQLDASLVLAFLDDLETARNNSARTRNARLAAIKSFARFLEYRVPDCLQQVHQLLAIPSKKTDEGLVAYLTRPEIQALLDAPDPRSRGGVRDRAMLHVAYAGGLRVSELVGLRTDEVGECQVRCRLIYHAEPKDSMAIVVPRFTSLSDLGRGFKRTAPAGSQLRIPLLHRPGAFIRARS